MRNWRKRWFLKRMVLGLAVAAVAAPVAQAVPDEGGGAGQSDPVMLPNGTTLTNEIVRARPMVLPNGTVLYDARAALTNEIVRAGTPAVVPEPMGSTVRGEFVKSNPLSPVSSGTVVQTGDGFDWGDAGIGAGVLFALMLALTGASLAVRRGSGHSGGTATA